MFEDEDDEYENDKAQCIKEIGEKRWSAPIPEA
jgi:hypothetical protein